MTKLADLLQTADWKAEKHVPVITVTREAEQFRAVLSVGKEIPHPNTTEHHIRWIELLFLPEGGKFPYQLGRYEFGAHGESAQGPNTSTVYSHPEITSVFKTEKPGMLFAVAYCNIHGLWQNSLPVALA